VVVYYLILITNEYIKLMWN